MQSQPYIHLSCPSKLDDVHSYQKDATFASSYDTLPFWSAAHHYTKEPSEHMIQIEISLVQMSPNQTKKTVFNTETLSSKGSAGEK